jgi:site-specific DNA-methyltransferase (adenine-specific)
VLSIVDVLPPGTICTETYLVVNHFDNQEEAENLAAFLRTRFARFLIAQLVFSQDMFKEKFEFVPVLDVTRSWSDEQLYEKYKITIEEVEFIESKIRPMESTRGA